MSVTGSVFASTVAFVFPPLCAIQIARLDLRPGEALALRHWWKPGLLLGFGVAVVLVCTGATIYDAAVGKKLK